METVHQISAGGVACRGAQRVEVALIKTATEGRWQLPKGIVDPGETPEIAALREVREEAGIECEIIEPLEVIEYWFVAAYDGGAKKRYHKKVHFFLMKFVSGDVADHDHEVTEARWIEINEAEKSLAFESERNLVQLAMKRLEEIG
jgi:8-oxo-dGTP pyrophosphatase MutT (NUDIX family)